MTREAPRASAAPSLNQIESALEADRQIVEDALHSLHAKGKAPSVDAAIEYSLFAPAKRLRPIVSLMVARLAGKNIQGVLPAACALEMVHTASLILDDLPAMDDAGFRRGRVCCHLVHGEATALLAAFALLNRAFGILADGWLGGPDPNARAEMAACLSRAIGTSGMIAGQAIDLESGTRTLDLATLEFIHAHKTGSLFTTAARLGLLNAQVDETLRTALEAYAKNLGLAFQVMDDWIDAQGSREESGKDVRQDLKKTTFVSFSGSEGARTLAAELVAASIAALSAFGAGAQPLRELAQYVLVRRR